MRKNWVCNKNGAGRSLVLLLEICIFFCNLAGGLLVTRFVSLDEKALLVITSTIPSLYIALFISTKTEYILKGFSLQGHSRFSGKFLVLSLFFFILISLNSNYPVYLLLIPISISYLSAKNAISLAKIYIYKGRNRYSVNRLLHVSIIQIGNLLYIFLFNDISIVFIPIFYLIAEMILLMMIKFQHISNSSEVFALPPSSKYRSVLSYYATTIGANYELFLIAIVAMIVGADWLAYISVSLSIISPFQVLPAVFVPSILSHRDNPLTNFSRSHKIMLFTLFVFFVSIVFLASPLESKIIELIFGRNYLYLTFNPHFLLIGGLLASVSRVIDSFLRKNSQFSASTIVNFISYLLFGMMIVLSEPSVHINRNIFLIFLIHFVLLCTFVVSGNLAQVQQNTRIKRRGNES